MIMPRSMTKIFIDEGRLVELIKMRPELYDPSNEFAKDNNRKKMVWEEISCELDASVDVIKGVWKKLNNDKRYRVQEIRKSTRLHSTDKLPNIFDNSPVNANENSLSNSAAIATTTTTTTTSGNCESAKRVLRSGLQFSAIAKTEWASLPSSLSSSFDSNKTRTIVIRDNAHQEPTINGTNVQTNQKNVGYCGKPVNDAHPKANNQQSQVIVDKSDRALRPRQLELLTVASKENTIPSRSPKTTSARIKSKQKKMININGATRSFFESMAMTVSAFPSHYQASIKMEICNIVAETEYKLSLEKTI